METSEQQIHTGTPDRANGAGSTNVGDLKETSDGAWLSVDLQSKAAPSTNLPIPKQESYGLSFADKKVVRQENRRYRSIQHATRLVGYVMESVEVTHVVAVVVADRGQDRIADIVVGRPRLPEMNKQIEMLGGQTVKSLNNKLGALLEVHFVRVSEIV